METDDGPVSRPEHHAREPEVPAGWKHFDFDTLSTLAASDPEAFERMRTAMIEDEINRMKPLRPERIIGLQFRIDMERQRSKAMSTCLRLSSSMLACVRDLEEPLIRLRHRIERPVHAADSRQSANDESFR